VASATDRGLPEAVAVVSTSPGRTQTKSTAEN
jgi:hypothetical protein